MFMDEDMVATGDVYELLEHVNEHQAVFVMGDQPKYEWPSFMVFNNALCKTLTPEFVQDEKNVLFDFDWAEGIGSLPSEWNHAVGLSDSREDAKLYHYTQGIPYWPECRGLVEDRFWFDAYKAMLQSVEWIDLHRNTRHFQTVMARYLKRYGFNLERKQ